MSDKLSDLQIYDLLHDALRPFLNKEGETPHGDTVIKATVKALSGMQLGILMIEAKNASGPPPKPEA